MSSPVCQIAVLLNNKPQVARTLGENSACMALMPGEIITNNPEDGGSIQISDVIDLPATLHRTAAFLGPCGGEYKGEPITSDTLCQTDVFCNLVCGTGGGNQPFVELWRVPIRPAILSLNVGCPTTDISTIRVIWGDVLLPDNAILLPKNYEEFDQGQLFEYRGDVPNIAPGGISHNYQELGHYELTVSNGHSINITRPIVIEKDSSRTCRLFLEYCETRPVTDFVPVQNIEVPRPLEITTHVPRLLTTEDIVVLPQNATVKHPIEIRIVSEENTDATVDGMTITAQNPGNITVRAIVPCSTCTGDFIQPELFNITVVPNPNWIPPEPPKVEFRCPTINTLGLTGGVISGTTSVMQVSAEGKISFTGGQGVVAMFIFASSPLLYSQAIPFHLSNTPRYIQINLSDNPEVNISITNATASSSVINILIVDIETDSNRLPLSNLTEITNIGPYIDCAWAVDLR